MLELRDVVKHYRAVAGEPVRAIDGVSMDVSAGELVALYGPSGSGKTTLLMVIAGLLRPDSGTLSFDGHDISAMTAREGAAYRMRNVGIVRQNLQLVPGLSAVDNAALKLVGGGARLGDAHRLVVPLLERLGLSHRLKHRPHQLSMGERQRVLIARALSTRPQLVLADEPTGSLDSRRGRTVLQLLTEICTEQASSMLLVTHDPQVAGFADTVHALRDGRLVRYEPDREAIPSMGL